MPHAPRPEPFELRTPAHFRALGSPARTDLLRALVDLSPATAADLAAALGKRVTALYRHLDVLADAGLVRVVGEEGEGAARRRVYAAVAQRYRVAEGRLQRSALRAYADAIAGDLRLAERCLRTAIEDLGRADTGPDRSAWAVSGSFWLTPEMLAALNERLDGAVADLGFTPPAPGARRVGVSIAVYPLDPAEPVTRTRRGTAR